MKYMSLVIKPKDAESARSKKPAGGGFSQRDMDDEIPFAPEFR
jgi:hypothetical protein